jgi:hypothetical protein
MWHIIAFTLAPFLLNKTAKKSYILSDIPNPTQLSAVLLPIREVLAVNW